MPQIQDATIARVGNWIIVNILKDTCDILRLTRVSVPSGGFTETYPVKYNGVPCAVIDAGNPQEALTAGQEVGFIPKIILLPKGQDILGSDRIRVNGATVYHVIDLFAPETYEIIRRVEVRRASLANS